MRTILRSCSHKEKDQTKPLIRLIRAIRVPLKKNSLILQFLTLIMIRTIRVIRVRPLMILANRVPLKKNSLILQFLTLIKIRAIRVIRVQTKPLIRLIRAIRVRPKKNSLILQFLTQIMIRVIRVIRVRLKKKFSVFFRSMESTIIR